MSTLTVIYYVLLMTLVRVNLLQSSFFLFFYKLSRYNKEQEPYLHNTYSNK